MFRDDEVNTLTDKTANGSVGGLRDAAQVDHLLLCDIQRGLYFWVIGHIGSE
jgi:hypothetical protein